MSSKTTIITIIGIGITGIIGFGAWNFWQTQQKLAEQDTAPNPSVTPVIRFAGEVTARKTARLGFEATGITQSVAVKIGDQVTPGQELIVLDYELQEEILANARANRASAQDTTKIALETAQLAATRTKEENTQKIEQARQAVIDSKRQLDQAREISRLINIENDDNSTTATQELALITAQKTYNAAQEELSKTRETVSKSNVKVEQEVLIAQAAHTATNQASLNTAGTSALAALERSARIQLARKVLFAPFSGTVTALEIEPNELAVAGQSIITIQTIDELEIEAAVSETDITKLAPGMSASVIFDAHTDQQSYETTITRINPAGQKIDGIPRYTVYLSTENISQDLRPGFTANIEIKQ